MYVPFETELTYWLIKWSAIEWAMPISIHEFVHARVRLPQTIRALMVR